MVEDSPLRDRWPQKTYPSVYFICHKTAIIYLLIQPYITVLHFFVVFEQLRLFNGLVETLTDELRLFNGLVETLTDELRLFNGLVETLTDGDFFYQINGSNSASKHGSPPALTTSVRVLVKGLEVTI